MSSRYKVADNQIPYLVTSTVVGWVDALSRDRYKEIICQSLLHCKNEKGLLLHAYVIMNNHVHFIVSANDGNSISGIMRDLKKFTSKKIIEAIQNNPLESRKKWMLNMFEYAGQYNSSNEVYQFWQQGYNPVELDTKEKTIQKLNYLHENPVRAGIVWLPENYKYSSAIDYYCDKPGILPIDKLHL